MVVFEKKTKRATILIHIRLVHSILSFISPLAHLTLACSHQPLFFASPFQCQLECQIYSSFSLLRQKCAPLDTLTYERRVLPRNRERKNTRVNLNKQISFAVIIFNNKVAQEKSETCSLPLTGKDAWSSVVER